MLVNYLCKNCKLGIYFICIQKSFSYQNHEGKSRYCNHRYLSHSTCRTLWMVHNEFPENLPGNQGPAHKRNFANFSWKIWDCE